MFYLDLVASKILQKMLKRLFPFLRILEKVYLLFLKKIVFPKSSVGLEKKLINSNVPWNVWVGAPLFTRRLF